MKRRFILVVCVVAVAVFLVPCSRAETDAFTGRVVGVSDGDTISVMRGEKSVRVRLWGIDTPESRQAFGNRAKQFTSAACFGKEVVVSIKDVDRYKRIVGLVILGNGRSLNSELVRAGMAWWYQAYAPDDAYLRELQARARKEKQGLWQDPSPVPPWEFRRNRTGGPQSDVVSRESESPRNPNTIVYVTKTGRRYHRKSCPALTDTSMPVTLEEARKRGLTACRQCRP